MTPEVKHAIEEIMGAFEGHRVDAVAEPQGGAYVVVNDLNIGDRYNPALTWFGFLISFQYPNADVYPHFIDGGLKRVDGRPHGAGFSGPVTWPGRSGQVLQLSRRSNRWNSAFDTAATKLAKVLEWMRSQ
jgi:hypothetical protein